LSIVVAAALALLCSGCATYANFENPSWWLVCAQRSAEAVPPGVRPVYIREEFVDVRDQLLVSVARLHASMKDVDGAKHAEASVLSRGGKWQAAMCVAHAKAMTGDTAGAKAEIASTRAEVEQASARERRWFLPWIAYEYGRLDDFAGIVEVLKVHRGQLDEMECETVIRFLAAADHAEASRVISENVVPEGHVEQKKQGETWNLAPPSGPMSPLGFVLRAAWCLVPVATTLPSEELLNEGRTIADLAANGDIDRALKRMEKIADASILDWAHHSIVDGLYRKREFDTARKLAVEWKVDRTDWFRIYVAQQHARDGEFREALVVAASIKAGPERVLLWRSIANAQIRGGELLAARKTVLLGWRDDLKQDRFMGNEFNVPVTWGTLMLAAGDVEGAIKILAYPEVLEGGARGLVRTDLIYRDTRVAEILAQYGELDAAHRWAEGLSDPEFRANAQLGVAARILQMRTEDWREGRVHSMTNFN
jgi:hypothetical protein